MRHRCPQHPCGALRAARAKTHLEEEEEEETVCWSRGVLRAARAKNHLEEEEELTAGARPGGRVWRGISGSSSGGREVTW